MLGDVKYVLRVVGRTRAWTLMVIVPLALGIGANTALFAALNGLVLRTIPVRDPDALVRFRTTLRARPGQSSDHRADGSASHVGVRVRSLSARAARGAVDPMVALRVE